MPAIQGERLTHRLRNYLKLGAKLLKMSEHEFVDRAISAKRLMEKIWQAIDWDDYLVDVLYENGNFTALVYDYDANLFAMPITFNGDDIELGERIRISESFDIVPVNEDATQREAINRALRGSIHVFRVNDKRYFISRSCTAIMNRVGEIDSTALFETMVDRFNSGNYDTPYFTLRHNGQDYYMGDLLYVGREGYVLVTIGVFDDNNGLADAAYESLERDADYWGTSIGYGLEDNDAPPEIVYVNYRSGENDISVPIPVYNQGTLIELSLLAERDAAAYYTNISRLEVQETMPVSRKKRSLKDDLQKLFPGQTELIDGVVAGTSTVNDLVANRGLIARSTDAAVETDAGESDAPATPVQSDAPATDLPGEIDLDDDMIDTLANRLADNPALLDAVAARLEVDPDADAAGGENLRSLVVELVESYHELQDAYDDLVNEREAQENRQSRTTRVRRRSQSTGTRPRDRHDSTRNMGQIDRGVEDDPEDFDQLESDFDAYLSELADGL